MPEDRGNCEVCGGLCTMIDQSACPYCNGTGEWNEAAMAYVKNHICQCITLDREFCPICGLKCHHSASLSPKQVIDEGGAGDPSVKFTGYSTSKNDEEIIIA